MKHVEYLRLGGVKQWTMIRGDNAANPPLVMLHGGPGFSETAFWRYHNAALERRFNVVYWDQRGAGKSADRDIPRSTMTVDQLVHDLDELVDIVRARFAQSKVVIFGHSWGSQLGVLYAARFPEKVAVYAGSGQLGDARAADVASYAWGLAEARRRGLRRAERALVEIGPPPFDTGRLMRERTWLQRLDGGLTVRAMWKIVRMIAGVPEASFLEIPAAMRAFRWCLDAMLEETSTMNLVERVPELRMPVFFLLGRKDHWVPPETSVAYFDRLIAPSKELVWFEHSGHEPFADEPAKFNAAMIDRVGARVAA